MLEGVLKEREDMSFMDTYSSFNPWYVGGGVKRRLKLFYMLLLIRFNPWYVGGGVKSLARRKHGI